MMAVKQEIESSRQIFSTELDLADHHHLLNETSWSFSKPVAPLTEFVAAPNLSLLETKTVEGTNFKVAIDHASSKHGVASIEKFESGDKAHPVTYEKLDRCRSELESHLGRALQPDEHAWSVEGGGIGKSNGFSDKMFIGKVSYDKQKNAVVVDVSYPVKQTIVYNSDGSSVHQFAGGAKTFTPATAGGK